MGVLSALLPTTDLRVLAIYSADPEALAPGEGLEWEPRLVRGRALVIVDFASRFSLSPGGMPGASQVAWRIPIWRPVKGRTYPELLVRWRVSSPGLAADWPRRLVGLHGGLKFSSRSSAGNLELDVRQGSSVLFALRAEPTSQLRSELFQSLREATELLSQLGPLAGASPLLSPAERAQLVAKGVALEPLCTHLAESAIPPGVLRADGPGLRLDCAVRLVDRTRRPLPISIGRAPATVGLRAPCPAT